MYALDLSEPSITNNLPQPNLLSTVNKDTLLNRLKLLGSVCDVFPGALCVSTKDELSAKIPLLGDVPLRFGLLVDDGVVVLQVAAAALCLEGGPQHVLVHCV